MHTSTIDAYYLDMQDKLSQAKALREKLEFNIRQASQRILSLSESSAALDIEIREIAKLAALYKSWKSKS